ncbi:MAG: ABC transporter permease [Firmicutes bacterium]|nr:ABC transporter permease [Bacillota bacterium]
MSALNNKLWRTIGKTKGQFLAVVAVVAIGIAVYISMTTAYYNLNASKEKFYRDHNFADYYFQVVKAPQEIIKQVETVPGVAKAAGRIQKDVALINDYNKRATARLTGYTLPMAYEINSVQLLSGRFFNDQTAAGQSGQYAHTGNIEILTDPQYAKGNNLKYGNTVTIVADGRAMPLTVVGTATGPEFVYLMKDAGTLLPDPQTFGVFMLAQKDAQQILNMPGEINQVLISFVPGADVNRVVGQVEAILKPYGNLGGYAGKDQLSNAMLNSELSGLKTSSQFMPVIFLGIAAAIQFVILGRMVRAQRTQIGVMKAIGYRSWQIIWHYTGYAVLVAVCGSAVGTLLGLALATVMSQVYALYFNLPTLIGAVNTAVILYGLILSITISTLAGLLACRSVLAINPAESMRSEPPQGGGKTIFEGWAWLWRRLDSAWKMSIRSVYRNKGRFAVTMFGVVFAVGMLVVSLFTIDAVNYMTESQFQQNERYDYLIRFAAPVQKNELFNIDRIKGVQKAEPLLEIPVQLTFNGRNNDDLVTGMNPGTTLKRLFDADGRGLQVPEKGLLISQKTAQKLGVTVGDMVAVETKLALGPVRQSTLKVMGINQQLVGGGCFVSLAQANLLLRDSQLVSGVMLKVEPAYANRLETQLDEMTAVSSILSRQKEIDNFAQTMGATIYSVSVLVFFALLLGFAIIYNASVISFSERQRELASLRVLGFSIRDLSGMLFKETILQSLLGVALGLPLGYWMAKGYIKSASTDLFTLPVIIYPTTYLFAALGGFAFILTAHFLAVKGIKRLQLVEVLKNKD